MSTLKEKLSRLGRPLRKLPISIDGEVVEVTYQRPTAVKDEMLRESMREEYENAMKAFKTAPQDGKSVDEAYRSEFQRLGQEKVVDYLIGRELKVYADEATRNLGRERPAEDADEAIKKLWFDEWKPIFDGVIDAARVEFNKEDGTALIDRAVESQLDQMAKDRAFEIYRRRLILDSIYDDENGQLVPVFTAEKEIDEVLAVDTINELGRMISEEVAKAREVPLKLVAKA